MKYLIFAFDFTILFLLYNVAYNKGNKAYLVISNVFKGIFGKNSDIKFVSQEEKDNFKLIGVVERNLNKKKLIASNKIYWTVCEYNKETHFLRVVSE